jgi:hypothetical protein
MLKSEQLESRVGIFWLVGERLILDASPLSEAAPYGDCLDHPTSHEDFWTAQQRLGAVPREMEYEESPRGRVVYNRGTKRFALYADRCILKRKSVIAKILEAMHLPTSQTDVTTDGPDGHYRCSRCLMISEPHENDPWG